MSSEVIRGGRSNPAYVKREREKNCARQRAKRAANKKPRKGQSYREYSFLRKYNLTLEQHAQMHANQSGSCAICRKLIDVNSRLTHVDHCHHTGVVRGLLCNWCNVALGWYEKVGKSSIESYLSE